MLYPPSQKKTGPFVEAPVRMAVWEAEELEGLEVEFADCEKETGDEVANSDLIRVLPDRLRKIQASIANPEHGEWGLPIYVPQFAMRLVELLASRSEAIRMVSHFPAICRRSVV